MYVIATAGHVDHGKSTLVRALTGMEPDRLADEHRRGLTIDLGFAWTQLPSKHRVAFVDVPGHERFLANMLAGVGPAPVVCFVVAADQGWQPQSSDHRDAVTALGIAHGLVVITRADRASVQQLATTEAQIHAELKDTPLEDVPVVVVSAADGRGLDDLVQRLEEVLTAAPLPDPDARLRLWVDRSFTITGAGTVLTGTLTAGTLNRNDRLQLIGEDGTRNVSVRGLQSLGETAESVTPHARVAVNLRDTPADAVRRGDALVVPDSWPIVGTVDIRRIMGADLAEAPQQIVAHIGTSAIPARLRSFDHDHARLTLQRAVPLQLGDRLVLRSSGSRSVLAGALVLDVDPPVLRRRGDGRRRAEALAARPAAGDPAAEVRRRGAVRPALLQSFGFEDLGSLPADIAQEQQSAWWVHRPTLDAWAQQLRQTVTRKLTEDPLVSGLAEGAARNLLERHDPPLPDPGLLPLVAGRAGLESQQGTLRPSGHTMGLGEAEASVAELERRLREHPFAAPEADDLVALRLGARELAAAERAGRLLRLDGGVVLLPQSAALAMRRLAAIEQPFTTSQARQALGTTRRVAIPLLEHLDARGWTRRVDTTRRSIN